MPKVYLTDRSRAEAAEQAQNEVFALALRTARGRTGKTNVVLCASVDISRDCICRLKHADNVGSARFETIRRLAHEMGLSAEEWLRLGGYRK